MLTDMRGRCRRTSFTSPSSSASPLGLGLWWCFGFGFGGGILPLCFGSGRIDAAPNEGGVISMAVDDIGLMLTSCISNSSGQRRPRHAAWPMPDRGTAGAPREVLGVITI